MEKQMSYTHKMTNPPNTVTFHIMKKMLLVREINNVKITR